MIAAIKDSLFVILMLIEFTLINQREAHYETMKVTCMQSELFIFFISFLPSAVVVDSAMTKSRRRDFFNINPRNSSEDEVYPH